MKINENYVIKVLAGEPILVHQDEHNVDFSKVISLNEIGLLIFQKIKEGLDVNQIVDCIISIYDVDRQIAYDDAVEYIDNLKRLGIVHD